MAVTEQTPIGGAVGNGVTTIFPFDYYVGQDSDLVVQIDGVTKTLNVDYTVTGAGNQEGGQIAFTVAPSSGAQVTHYRDTGLERSIDYQTSGDLLANVLDFDIDRLWLALQEIFGGGKGAPTALRVPAGETVPPLPKATDRANRIVGFDSSGNPIAVLPTPGDSTALALDLANKTSAAKGPGQIGFNGTLNYASGTLGGHFSGLAVNVKDYPWLAKFDGVTDDAPAINAALQWVASQGGGIVEMPRGTGVLGSQLQVLTNCVLRGQGGRQTALNKKFNGDAMTLASGVQLHGFQLLGGNGAYTGRGLVPSGFNILGVDVLVEQFSDNCLYYPAPTAGNNSRWLFCSFIPNAATIAGVHFPVDGTACPRYFTNCTTSGSPFCDGGGNDTFIVDCFMKWLGTDANSEIFTVKGCRMALLGGTATLLGGGHVIVGNTIAGTVILGPAATGITLCDNQLDDVIFDAAVGNFNRVTYRPKSYAPNWLQNSGTQPSLGNGTLTGTIDREGMLCNVSIKLTMGSTTTFGNNATGYRFSVIHKAATAVMSQKQYGVAYITDASTGVVTTHKAEIAPNEDQITISNMAGGAVRDGSPIAWAVGDTIEIAMSYQCL